MNPRTVGGNIYRDAIDISDLTSTDSITVTSKSLFSESADTTDNSSFYRGDYQCQFRAINIAVFKLLNHLTNSSIRKSCTVTGVGVSCTAEQGRAIATDEGSFIQVGSTCDRTALKTCTEEVEILIYLTS